MQKKYTIEVRELKVECIVGINPEEKHTKQTLIVDVKIKFLSDKPRLTIEDTVDYAVLSAITENTLIKGKFDLLENALAAVADLLKKRWSFITYLEISIQKPNALPHALACAKLIQP